MSERQFSPRATNASRSSEDRSDAATHINKAAKLLAQMEKDQKLKGALARAKGVFLVSDYGRAALDSFRQDNKFSLNADAALTLVTGSMGSSAKGSTSSSASSNRRDASRK
jgi:lipid-binding SYLF domain-containing protein